MILPSDIYSSSVSSFPQTSDIMDNKCDSSEEYDIEWDNNPDDETRELNDQGDKEIGGPSYLNYHILWYEKDKFIEIQFDHEESANNNFE